MDNLPLLLDNVLAGFPNLFEAFFCGVSLKNKLRFNKREGVVFAGDSMLSYPPGDFVVSVPACYRVYWDLVNNGHVVTP